MALQIPLVVALWEHAGFGGRKRLIVENTTNLLLQAFNDKTSAIGVHPGPDSRRWQAAAGWREPPAGPYEDINPAGAALLLTTGASAITPLLSNVGDQISSVRFNPRWGSAGTSSPIPLVVEL